MSIRRSPSAKDAPPARRASKKTAKKTAQKFAKPSPKTGVSLPVGNHPGNTGGKKGRSGRPPMAFKNFIAQLRQNPKVQQELEDTLLDRNSKAYAAALRVIVDYDEELPANISPEQRKKRVLELMREASLRQKKRA